MKQLNFIEILSLNAYWVGLSFMWSSLHVILLPALLLHYAPETHKNTYLGLLTFAGLVIAMLVQPVSGAISDSWVSRWGKRRPLMLAGTVFNFFFLVILGWLGGLFWLAIGYIGLQLSSNVAHGPAQGLLPDQTPPKQIGAASGIKNLMDMAGLVIASLLMGRLVDPNSSNAVIPVSLVMAVLAMGAAITLLGVREKPSLPFQAKLPRFNIRESMRVDFRTHSEYWWLIASRFAFLLGIYNIQAFAQYYVRDVLVAPNPVKVTGDLLAAITLALIAFALVGGWLGDRIGHRRTLLLSSLVSTVGCLLLLFANSPSLLLVYGSVLGAGIGLFLTSNWAMANQLAPVEEAGKYLGLTNLATAGAAATGRLGGPLIDIVNNAQPGAYWGYTMLFVGGAACALVSGLLLLKVFPGKALIEPEQQAL
jgi:MFS family permease